MNFAALKAEVRENVIDLPTTVTNRVPKLINRAIRELQTRHNFKVMETQYSYTTTVGTRVVGTGVSPNIFKGFMDTADPFYVDEAGTWHQMKWAPNERAVQLMFNEVLDIGPPKYLVETFQDADGMGDVKVYPLPDGNSDYVDGEYRIKVWAYVYLNDLINDNDEHWFTTFAEEYIIMRATAYAFLVDWDEERAGVWMQFAENKLKEVIRADKMLRLSTTDTLVPLRDVNAPRLGL